MPMEFKDVNEQIREELSDFPESEEKENAISLAIQMVEVEGYFVAEAAREVAIELREKIDLKNTIYELMVVGELKKFVDKKGIFQLENNEDTYFSLEKFPDTKNGVDIFVSSDEKSNNFSISLYPLIEINGGLEPDSANMLYSFMVDQNLNLQVLGVDGRIENELIEDNNIKIVDINYDEGLDFDDVSAQIPTITTDNDVVTDGEIVRYTAILSSAKSLSVFYDKATGEYTYNGKDLTKLENDICEDIGTELQKANGDYEDIIKKLTAVAVDLVPNNSVLDEFKDDFINPVVDKESADELIASISWDNWEDEDEDNEPTGEYYKVESVLWNRIGALIENEDDGTDEDSEFDDVKEQIELYFKAIGENGIIKQSSSLQDLHDYFEKITIQISDKTDKNQELSIKDYAERYDNTCGKIEDILVSSTIVQELK